MNDVTSEVQTVQEPKAVQVARDVLAHLGVYRVQTGRYLMGRVQGIVDRNADLSSHLAEVEEVCSVCALGALLLSKARLYDNVPVLSLTTDYPRSPDRDYLEVSGSQVRKLLADVFRQHQLHMIESAFEQCSNLQARDYEGISDIRDSIAFGQRYHTARERLQAIMENIVENEGEFSPPHYSPDLLSSLGR